MTALDLADLGAHWRRHPPTHLAVAALERTLLAVNGVDPGVLSPPEEQRAPRFVDESAVRAFVAQLNGA